MREKITHDEYMDLSETGKEEYKSKIETVQTEYGKVKYHNKLFPEEYQEILNEKNRVALLLREKSKISSERLKQIKNTSRITITADEYANLPQDIKYGMGGWDEIRNGAEVVAYQKAATHDEYTQEENNNIINNPSIVLSQEKYKELDPSIKNQFTWVEYRENGTWGAIKYRKATPEDIRNNEIQDLKNKVKELWRNSSSEYTNEYKYKYSVNNLPINDYSKIKGYRYITQEMKDEYENYLQKLNNFNNASYYLYTIQPQF
jgi:hypothetical protein